MGYEINESDQGLAQSTPTVVQVPAYHLPKPIQVNSGLSIRLRGGVEAPAKDRDNGSTYEIGVYDSDGVGNPDEKLIEIMKEVQVPENAWPGVLIPYDFVTNDLFFKSGNVAGPNASSGEETAEVYQFLKWADIQSDYILIP